MTIEEDVENFVTWANRLGFPVEDIPSDEAIKSIFKSRQCDLFYNLLKRVRPRQEVSEIRENILIRKLEKLRNQVVPTYGRCFLPKEYQTFLKMKDLSAKKSDLETQIEVYRKEYEKLSASIKTKNMQHIKLQHKHETLRARVNLFDVKLHALVKDIEQEQQNKKRLLTTMPVKLNTKNACEKTAAVTVGVALRQLEDFYNVYVNNNNPTILRKAKDDLWTQLRTTFADMPNFMLFNAIMRLKEEQLQNIMTLNKSSVDDSVCLTRSLSSASGRDQFTPFELKLMKTIAESLGIVAKYLAAHHERALLEERFSSAYPQFVDDLQKKVNLFNGDIDESAEDIISEYIVQYNLRNHHKSKNEFFAEQIEMYKALLETGARQLEDHEVLLGSIKQVYTEISNSVNRIQYEMLQLDQTKQKILYSKNMLQHMLSELQASNAAANAACKSKLLPSKMKLNNQSILCGESFELSCDVFSSTKLDLNATSCSLSNTNLCRSWGSAGDSNCQSLPPHVVELQTFKEIPLEKFSCIPKECAFYISPNPLIVATRELSSTTQLAPGSLLTPYGALKEVQHRIRWAESIRTLSTNLKIDMPLTIVDTQAFKLKNKQQREQIAELLDKIDATCDSTKHILQKVNKLYDFILENPLRNYIPASKCFNNQTYSHYESEFTMYYRMATMGGSIK